MHRFVITQPVWRLRAFFLTALSIGCFICAAPEYARATPIGGGILSGDTVWTLAGSPYQVAGIVQVGAGTTLTIQAGVAVKFSQNAGIKVASGGSLTAVGSAAAPVVFTDIGDDTAGGDTNGDHTQPVPGSWDGIAVDDGANALLRYAHVRYAVTAILKTGAGPLTMEDCNITNSSDEGLDLNSTTADHMILRCQFKNNDVGIFISDTLGNTTINSCYLSGNNYGIILFGVLGPSGGSIFVCKSTITGNDIAILYSDGPSVTIGGSSDNRNNILKNTTIGVDNQSPDVRINATHNWWGDYLGPTHPSNPNGRGDTVSDNVDFSDFARISALAGDLNNDNGVGLEDVIVGLQVMTGIPPAIFHPEFILAGIDVNGDGRAGLAEAIYGLRIAAGFNR
jgi:hypothetical protein